MSTAAATDELRSRVTEQVAAWEESLAQNLPSEALAALALVPAWTEGLAGEAKFPASPLLPFLEEAERRGLCVRGPVGESETSQVRSARTLMLLWPFLDRTRRERWIRQILEKVRSVPTPLERLQYLVVLSSHDCPLEGEILPAIQESPDPEIRTRMFVAWALACRSIDVAKTAWESLDQISDPEERAGIQISLLPLFDGPEPFIETMHATIDEIRDREARSRALLALAAFLAGQQREELINKAFDDAFAVDDLEERTLALCALAPLFDADKRSAMFEAAVRAAGQITPASTRARLLFHLSRLDQSTESAALIRSTIEETRSQEKSEQRDGPLALLVAALAPTDFDEANALRESIRAPSARLDALVALVRMPNRSASLSDEAIAAEAAELIDRTGRYELCGDFVPHLTPGLIAVRRLVRQIEDRLPEGRRRREALLNLASHLPGDDGRSIFEDLLQSSQVLYDERDLLEAFAQIAPYLPSELLDKACELALALPSDRRFAMPDPMRPVVVGYLKNRKEFGSEGVRRAVSRIGHRIADVANHRSLDVVPATLRWARLAALCDNPSDAHQFLTREAGRLVEARDLGAAIEWYTTAERIDPMLDGELRQSILLARREVELASRRIMDARHLERYLERAGQATVFQQLLDDPTRWALHYLGMGGVGKTMLLRYIVARLAIREGKALPVARLDFDDITPEFPVREPGTLLLRLADDLRRCLPPGEDDRFKKFSDEVRELHGALSREDSPDDPLANLHTNEFARLLESFVAMISGLPKPAVLILDTCEELAKAEPVGTSIPAVDATFEILERLHALDSGIRVVFAGRRLLARGGDALADGQLAWRVREESQPERMRILPKPKEYLRLHLVRGFTEGEADQYLSRVLREPLDAPRRTAILKRSADTPLAPDIEFDSQLSPDTEPRYNPFDISLYADWLLADRKVTAEMLASGEKDPYVEMRIVGRVGKELLPVIPGAVLLRRFDQPMLQPMLDADPHASARLFRDLGGQEWIDLRDGFLQVNVNLLNRLYDYYRKHEPLELERASQRLGPALNELAQSHLRGEAPFDKRTFPLLDAALRVLPLADGALLWDRFERRLTEVRNWSAAQRVCEPLLGPGNAAGEETSPLASAVRATLIAARTHTSRDYSAAGDWEVVLKTAPSHPSPPIRSWLEARARIGLRELTSGTTSQALLSQIEHLMPSLDEWQAEQLQGAICAVIEEQVENGNRVSKRIAGLIDDKSPELAAYVRALRKQSVVWSQPSVGRVTMQRWLDWRAPASIRDRSRLLSLQYLLKNQQALETRCSEVLREVETIDSDRLASALLRALLDRRAIGSEMIAPVEGKAYDPHRIPVTHLHHEIPPLFTSIAEVMIATGRGDDAQELAGSVRYRAQSNQDAPSADAAELIRLKAIRRYRLLDAMTALHKLVAVQHPNAFPFHSDWAVQCAGSAEEARTLVDAVPFVSAANESEYGTANDPHSTLDFMEAELIAKRIGLDRSFVFPVTEAPLGTTGDLRVALRVTALRGAGAERFRPEEPPRRLAEAMLEEGELLVLRLPDRSLWLFSNAHEAYVRASDSIGAMLAALCATIAALKADAVAEARRWFDRAETYYGHFTAASQTALPAWQDLSASSIQDLHRSIWYPWLLRIGLINARLTDGPAGGPLTRDMQKLIARFLGNDGHPDFTLKPFEKEISPEVPKGTAGRSPVTKLGPILLGLVLLGAVIVSIVWAIAWIGGHPQWYPILATLAVAFVAWGTGRWACRRLAYRAVRDEAVRLDVSARPDSSNASMAFRLRHRSLSGLAFRLLDIPETDINEDVALTAVSQSEASPRGPATRVSRELEHLRRRLHTRPIVPLYVSESAARYSWEMLLDLPLERPGVALDERVSIVRAAPARPVSDVDRPLWNGVVGVVAAREFATTFVKGWRRASTVAPPVDPRVGRVLHLIGRPKRTRSGPTLIVPVEKSATAPFNLREWNADCADLLVVQEEPVERLHRLNVDRQQTAEARAWAAQAFDAGVQSLILIPAMPAEAASCVIEAIGWELRPGVMPQPSSLIAAVTRARRRLARFDAPDVEHDRTNMREGMDDVAVIEALNELAFEITLFVRSKSFSRRNPFTGFS